MSKREEKASLLLAGSRAEFRKLWSQGVELRYALREVAHRSELEQRLVTLHPELLLLDLDLCRDGVSSVPSLQRLSPATKILVLSAAPDVREGIAALKMGAKGYCRRDISPHLLRKAVEMICEGQLWMERMMVPHLLEELAALGRAPEESMPEPRNPADLLTRRERDVLDLIANGANNREIARQLGLTESAVRGHVQSIFRKFQDRSSEDQPDGIRDGLGTTSPRRLRLLLVDDSPAALTAAAQTLALEARVEVVGCAKSGVEALARLHEVKPDLVLMDLAMPEMDGLQATREMKKLPSPPRVIIYTFHDEPEFRAAALNVGADGFIPKDKLADELPPILERLTADSAERKLSLTG